MKIHLSQMIMLDDIMEEIEKPQDFQAREKFCTEDKFAIIIANEFFSDIYIGMDDLPAVNDDLKVIR